MCNTLRILVYIDGRILWCRHFLLPFRMLLFLGHWWSG